MVTECLTCSWRFLRSNKLEQLEFKLEKLLGFRNMQEKLEKSLSFGEFFFGSSTNTKIGPWILFSILFWLYTKSFTTLTYLSLSQNFRWTCELTAKELLVIKVITFSPSEISTLQMEVGHFFYQLMQG